MPFDTNDLTAAFREIYGTGIADLICDQHTDAFWVIPARTDDIWQGATVPLTVDMIMNAARTNEETFGITTQRRGTYGYIVATKENSPIQTGSLNTIKFDTEDIEPWLP